MQSSSENEPRAFRVYERAALAVTVLLFLLALLTRRVVWDWLFDSAFLAAAVLLAAGRSGDAVPRNSGLVTSRRTALFLCSYVFVDSLVLCGVFLRTPGLLLVVYGVLSVLYGAALLQRLRREGVDPRKLRASPLLRPPAFWWAGSAVVALLCMYLPMVHDFYGFRGWSGPMVVRLPGTITMDAGHMVTIGGTVVLRGCEVAWGHLVLLLLGGFLVLPFLKLAGVLAPERVNGLSRIGIMLVVLWWMFVARGYRSFDYLFNDVFLAGCLLLLATLFVPRRAE